MKKTNTIFLILSGIILSSCGGSSGGGSQDGVVTGSVSYSDSIFPPDNPWNKDISNEPLDPDSDTYITSLGKNSYMNAAFGTWWDGAPNGQPYVVVSGSQAMVPIHFNYDDWGSDPGPYPVPADAPIQGGPGSDGDRHVIVIDKDNGILYELYRAFPIGDGSWTADSGAKFNLRSNEMRPANNTSADAAGLPIFPGLVRYEEVMIKKEINHAIRFTANKTRKSYVYPARHASGPSRDLTLPPMGMRVRLKANYNISNFPASAQVILKALKRYGMILADNGSSWMISGAPDERWIDQELHTLRTVPGSAFEVVKMGAVTPIPW